MLNFLRTRKISVGINKPNDCNVIKKDLPEYTKSVLMKLSTLLSMLLTCSLSIRVNVYLIRDDVVSYEL